MHCKELKMFLVGLVNDYDIEPLAETVLNGTWTIDKMGEITKTVQNDINGDGKLNTADYVLLKRFVMGVYTLTPEGFQAACIRGDKPITADYVLLKRHVMGTHSIYGETAE